MNDSQINEELLNDYNEALKQLSIKLEDNLTGNMQVAVSRLQDVYIGQGATAFFARYDQTRSRVADALENIHLLRMKLNELNEPLRKSHND